MECLILGCGASLGTPIVGCGCTTCTSSNEKNKRSRSSIFLKSKTTNILIDLSTDFRSQALKNKITKIDSVFFTHPHADHIVGIDDIKPIAFDRKKPIQTYMNLETWEALRAGFGYIFNTKPGSIYSKFLEKNIIKNYDTISVGDIKIRSFAQNHGEIKSLGFRIGDFAYSTDVKLFPKKSHEFLKGLKIWILGCLRYTPSPSHASYEQVLDWIRFFKPELTILTHLGHEIEYEDIKKKLPRNVISAYDGMTVKL